MMNVSSVLGLHGWLHVIMFAVIAILIKRCAEMQQLPGYHDNKHRLHNNHLTTDLKKNLQDKDASYAKQDGNQNKMLHDTGQGQDTTSDTEWLQDTGHESNAMKHDEHTGRRMKGPLDTTPDELDEDFIQSTENPINSDRLLDVERLQEDTTSAYCSTDINADLNREPSILPHSTSNHDLFTRPDYELEDDITMLTSEATAMSEDPSSNPGTYDLLSKASTFFIDSTVGTFMQMTQAYMQDDYPASQHVEPHSSHVIQTEGSSVWCWGSHHTQRFCRFHNLCYLPEHDDFVFFHSPNTIISGTPPDRFSPTLLDISSVHDHNGQYFNYVDLPASQAAGLQVEFIEATSLIYRRFNPDNLMHVVHDDLLPMFYTLHMISENNTRSLSSPFDIQLVFLEGWTPGDYINLYQIFSSYKPMFKSELQAKTKLTCFSDAYVGITKATTWYQYGFREPQGPIPGHTVTAHEVRMFTSYLKDRLETHSITVPNGQDYIVLFTRKHNRLILNEVELTLALVTQLRVKVITVGVETHSVAEMVAILSKAAVLVGMHGSLLSLAMFLRPGAILVELFPYAVNPDHYTPYRTLSRLPGMNILYKSWRNIDQLKSIGHPERAWDTGGIAHLSKEEQERILHSSEVPRHLCCRDPEWLYRIYQDTIVDTDALVSLVSKAMEEREQIIKMGLPIATEQQQHRLHPGQVLEMQCDGTDDAVPSSIHNLTPPSISLSWQPPWNVQYLNAESIKYEVWIQEQTQDHYTAWILSRTSYKFSTGLKPQTNYSIWVRCIMNDHIHGPFNKDHISCST